MKPLSTRFYADCAPVSSKRLSPAASATDRIEIPVDGANLLRAVCWWPERAGGFAVLVDESNMRGEVLHPTKDGPLRSWTLEKLAVPL
jgi:hypothetical protein